MINVLFIGWSGYLGQHILSNKKIKRYQITEFKGRVENLSDFEKYINYGFDQVWHFGSKNAESKNIAYIIEKGTRNVITFTKTQNAKLVYASSMGIFQERRNVYEQAKKNATMEVVHTVEHVNLIIPRVYSKDRKSGLIQAIKDKNKLDLHKTMFFIKIDEFTNQFFEAIKGKNIEYRFNRLVSKTIEEIRDWIL